MAEGDGPLPGFLDVQVFEFFLGGELGAGRSFTVFAGNEFQVHGQFPEEGLQVARTDFLLALGGANHHSRVAAVFVVHNFDAGNRFFHGLQGGPTGRST